MMKTNKNLKPCPFCGHRTPIIGKDTDAWEGMTFMINCLDCSAKLHEYTMERLIKLWNTCESLGFRDYPIASFENIDLKDESQFQRSCKNA